MKNLGFLWCLILGGFGFAVGFFGPMIFAPGANQGPLLGIFITGPIGFVSGMFFWLLSSQLNWKPKTQINIAAAGCVLLLFSVVLVAIWPKPEWVGRLYELEVTSCELSGKDNGSVVKVKITTEKIVNRKKPFFGKREEYRAFQIFTKEPETGSFYIAEPCSKLPAGFKGNYFVSSDTPRKLVGSQSVATLEAVPAYLSDVK